LGWRALSKELTSEVRTAVGVGRRNALPIGSSVSTSEKETRGRLVAERDNARDKRVQKTQGRRRASSRI
jgi:hypothetical protein